MVKGEDMKGYTEEQNEVLLKKLADAQIEIRRLDSDLQNLVHRLNEATRHRDDLLIEVRETNLLLEKLQHLVGNVMTAHAEIVKRIDLEVVDPRLAEAVRNLTTALKGHFIDE